MKEYKEVTQKCNFYDKINFKIKNFEKKFKLIEEEECKKKNFKHNSTIFDFNLNELKAKVFEKDKDSQEEKFINIFENISTEWYYIKVLLVKIIGCLLCKSERSQAVKRFDKIKEEIEEKLDINNYFETILNFMLLRGILLDNAQINNLESIKKKLINNN